MMQRIFLLLAGLVAMTLVGLAHGCRCVEYSPKRGACQSDFVIRAEVHNVTTANNIETYNLQIKDTFKSNAAYRSVVGDSGSTSLRTHVLSSCRIHLNAGVTYLLTGHVNQGALTVIQCNYHAPWHTLSPEQQQGFRRDYYPTCN